MQEMQVPSLGWEELLENEIATHTVFLSGEFHGPSIRVGYNPWDLNNWMTKTFTFHLNASLIHMGL